MFTVNSLLRDCDVSYVAGGVEYGPFQVLGAVTAEPGAMEIQLSPLQLASGPLTSAVISADLEEFYRGAIWNQIQASPDLPADGSDGSLITADDVNTSSDNAEAMMAAAIAAFAGVTTFFYPNLPNYNDSVGAEGEVLMAMTGGRASNVDELRILIDHGVIPQSEAFATVSIAKLMALLGLQGFGKDLGDVLEDQAGDLLEKLGEQVDSGDDRAAGKTAAKILDKMASKSFGKALVKRVGAKKAGKIAAKVGSKFVPLIEWAGAALTATKALIEQIFWPSRSGAPPSPLAPSRASVRGVSRFTPILAGVNRGNERQTLRRRTPSRIGARYFFSGPPSDHRALTRYDCVRGH